VTSPAQQRETAPELLVSREGSGLAGFAWTSGGRFVLQAANLVALTVTSRFISPAEFGLFAPVAIFAGLIYSITEGTFATALLQRNDLKDDHVRVSVWSSIITAAVTTTLLVLSAPLIEAGFGFNGLAGVLAVSALMLPARLVSAVPSALLQRSMRFRDLAVVPLFTSVVGRILPTIVLAVSGFGVWALVVGYIIQAYLDAAIFLYLARPSVRWPSDWGCARDVLSFGGRFMAIHSVNQLALNVDNVIVGRLLGPAALGFYSRAFTLMMLPVNLLGSSAQQVLFPRFARLQDDKATLKNELYSAIDLVSGLMMPLTVLLAIVADSLVLLLLGNTWAPVIVPTRILFAASVFRIGYKVTETVSFATATLRPALVRQVGYAILIAGGALIGSQWSLSGVAIGVGVALISFYFSSLAAAVRIVDARWSRLLLIHLRGLAMTVLATGPAAAIASFEGHSLLERVGADVGAGVLFCLSMTLILFKGPRWLTGSSADVVADFATRITRKIKATVPRAVEPTEERGVL
jgi:O-antigen/teichoic acid export membrane protein